MFSLPTSSFSLSVDSNDSFSSNLNMVIEPGQEPVSSGYPTGGSGPSGSSVAGPLTSATQGGPPNASSSAPGPDQRFQGPSNPMPYQLAASRKYILVCVTHKTSAGIIDFFRVADFCFFVRFEPLHLLGVFLVQLWHKLMKMIYS